MRRLFAALAFEIQSMKWLKSNKEWVFSGIGVAILMAIVSFLANFTVHDDSNNPSTLKISQSLLDIAFTGRDPLTKELLNGESCPFKVLPGTESRRYSLALLVRARFMSPAFNKKMYLKGLSGVELLDNNKDITLLDAYEKEVSSFISWIVILRFSEKPEEPFLLRFKSGFREWKIEVDDLKWNKYVNRDLRGLEFWWGAQKSYSLQLADPDIVLLSTARMRKLRNKEELWIEVILENLSSSNASFSELALFATHSTHNLCPCSVKVPDWQSVNLNWSSILAKNPMDNLNGVWTVIKKENIIAQNFYSEKCSSFDFKTIIPIQVDMEPKTKIRFSLKMIESSNNALSCTRSEQTKDFSIFERRLHPPCSLYDWDDLQVSIYDDDLVFPKRIEVIK